MKKVLKAVFSVIVMCSFTLASEIDILTQKLLEKGVLDSGEAQQVLAETKDEVVKNLTLGQAENVPAWVQKLNLKSDVRYRIQTDKTLDGGSVIRLRERIRLRVNGIADLGESFKLGFGFSSGTDDPRSTNQTLENVFQHPDLRIDMAWGEYSPIDGAKIMAGKFPYGSFLFKPSDLLFDTDINFEGAAANYSTKVLGETLGVFAELGYLNLDESSSLINDPGLVSVQAGITSKPVAGVSVKAGAALHMFENVQGYTVSTLTSYGAGTSNTVITSTSTTYTTVTTLTNTSAIGRIKTDTTTYKYKYDYDCLNFNVEVGFADMLLPMTKLFAEVVINTHLDAALLEDQKQGYIVGVSFGDSSVNEFGKWQVMLSQRMLGKDAWVDFLADSDAYSGKTACLVNELKVTFGLSKNTSFEFDFYEGRAFPAQTSNTDAQIAQFDFNFKF